ncbi:TrmB family transcriptional regulator [Haloarchaeobius sp. TZWWS8]|uniref:TrmB family transcriptional regulator n=1 Tax=Haloarchaeobius sp. TZWWS8 TaxID=3446121 RepID=UPI003EBA4794
MSLGEDDAVDSLERLGLTSYEAKVFIALQKLGTGTARDVSRVADVPRSQVYSVTESLEDRGLIDVQQSSPMQYRPVSIEKARTTLRQRFERESDRAFDYVEHVREQFRAEEDEQESIWTVRGRETVTDRALDLIQRAEERIIFPARHPELVPDTLVTALAERGAEGLDVLVMSENPDVLALFEDDPVATVEPHKPPHPDSDRFARGVFADDDILLLSVLGEGEELPGIERETAFWSAHSNFARVLVQLFQSSVVQPEW